MSWPTSILRATRRPLSPIPTCIQTPLFTHSDENKLFPCPHCGRRFYSFSGQASHIAQTNCRFLEQARLSAERVKRSFDLNLGLVVDDGRDPKRVRFKGGDVDLEVRVTTPGSDAIDFPGTTPHARSVANELTPEHIQSPDNLSNPSSESEPSAAHSHISPSEHLTTEDGGHSYIERYPDPSAGSPINGFIAPPFDLHAYIQAAGSLSNLDHFNTLELLMTVGLTDKGRDRMLKSRAYRGRTPWRNCAQMLKDLDALPHGPKWVMYEIEMKMKDGSIRAEYLFGRNIIDLVRGIIGDWTLKCDLRYAPIRVWTTKEHRERMYSEAWTGEWWWRMQYLLRPKDKFATVVPLIIATDKTHLSVMCGGQIAYPVYVSIGNVPKSIRRKVGKRATVLLGYLPVDDFADVADPNERARLKHQLTHNAMSILMEPLKQAAEAGVVMTCADGHQRRIYPIPAAFEGDWPEQCYMACVDEGSCPICEQVFSQRSHYPNLAPNRKREHTLAALYKFWQNDKDPGELAALRLKPWWPWWASIPSYNFHVSIMPDLLHQLYQGMIKTHAIAWVKKVVGVGLVDRCFRSMPGAVGLRHFEKGISKVTQWTGRESKEMAKQLLPVVAGQKPDFVSLIRSVLDFTFRAHQSQMTEGDLERLTRALGEFHAKKESLVPAGIYGSLDGLNNVKKLHMLTHYAFAIRELGTPDGYNTESPEHLHIIYAKRGWRASNKVRPLPQMTKFIQRYEALRIHRMYIDMYYDFQPQDRVESRVVYGEDEDAILEDMAGEQNGVEELAEERVEEEVEAEAEAEAEAEHDNGDGEESDGEDEGEQCRIQSTTPAGQHVYLDPDWSMAIRPTVPHVTGFDIVKTYGAFDFESRANKWLEESIASGLLPRLQTITCLHKFNVWHKFHLHHRPLHFDPDQPPRRETIRAKPPAPVRENSLRSAGPGTFDTVLFLAQTKEFGIHRYRAGRVRVIFTLPSHLYDYYPHPLVYLELFTPFSKEVSSSHRMHMTAQDIYRGTRCTAVLPLVWVVAACHIAPVFGQYSETFPLERHDLLSIGKDFFLNHYSSHFIFGVIDHWRAIQEKISESKAMERRALEEETARAKAARAKAMRARLVHARDKVSAAHK